MKKPAPKTRSIVTSAQVQQQMKNDHENEVLKAIQKWADETIYEGPTVTGIVDKTRKAMMNFSDLILKMPYETYKAIAVADQYTYMQVEIILQILGMASAKDLGMHDMSEYIAFKDELQTMMGAQATAMSENRQRINDENPFIQTVGEA